MRNYLRTIHDLMNLVYGGHTRQELMEIFKADDPLLSTTSGVYNAVFGAQVWRQINQEANVFAALPKFVWDKSGWRVLSAAAGAAADGGVVEQGTLPDTIKPTFVEVSTKPKHVVHGFTVSLMQEIIALSDDDAYGTMEQMRVVLGEKHREAINEQLLRDVNSVPAARFESIDRVCSSNSEITPGSLDANDADIYGLDRDAAASWADAYVDVPTGGTDRELTDGLVRTAFQNIGENGGNTSVVVTGWDTYRKLLGLYDPQVRYEVLGRAPTTVGYNGINTPNGFPVGLKISTLYGIPMIISSDVLKDTISRIYFLDTTDPEGYGKPRLGFKTAFPTLYFESPDFFGVNKLTKEGYFITAGELICHMFKAQGKIRDLK